MFWQVSIAVRRALELVGRRGRGREEHVMVYEQELGEVTEGVEATRERLMAWGS